MRMTRHMTIAEAFCAAAPVYRPAPIGARISGALSGVMEEMKARRAERRMLLLSDAALRDIGVSRAELEARNPGAPSRPFPRPEW